MGEALTLLGRIWLRDAKIDRTAGVGEKIVQVFQWDYSRGNAYLSVPLYHGIFESIEKLDSIDVSLFGRWEQIQRRKIWDLWGHWEVVDPNILLVSSILVMLDLRLGSVGSVLESLRALRSGWSKYLIVRNAWFKAQFIGQCTGIFESIEKRSIQISY